MNRRRFIERSVFLAAAPFVSAWIQGCQNASGKSEPSALSSVPAYLKDFKAAYQVDPRGAALEWFTQAKFGLFMHFGLYSLLGRGEWVMFSEKIPVAEYKKLKSRFNPERFDADFITDLACRAEMKYVNITSRHHDGFCLFETSTSDYHSVNSPSKRDLIAELAVQCQKKGLALFLYYSLGADWQHPYFYPRKYNTIAQPEYASPEPSYQWQNDDDFSKYMEYAHRQIRELMTNYGPIAGMWFDPLIGYYGRPDLFPIEQTYAMVRQLQPHTLISFKQGATGTEDFAAPERSGRSLEDNIRKRFGEKAAAIAKKAWESNKNKHNEICNTLQEKAWGYNEKAAHKTTQKVLEMLSSAIQQKSNLLLNTGPLPDGSIHPEDIKVLSEVGKHI
ncbi:MAG: alpha-L-fucosidase precursor [Planctomycetes bacterium]|nr:alpha-L-fucosidase precursor [Planctomycetota bacterium]